MYLQKKRGDTMLYEQHTKQKTIQKKQNKTGIPEHFKQNIEKRSGFSMDDVKVHYHSSRPAQLQALAYTQDTNVYIAPGQEKHLMHELTHVVQQKQGIVKANSIINGVAVNTDATLEREADNHYIRPTAQCKSELPPVTQCLFDSDTLGKKIGKISNDGNQAHHIIPIEIIHASIQKANIINLHEFDQGWNGILLPQEYEEAKGLPAHKGSHPKYTTSVLKLICTESGGHIENLVASGNKLKLAYRIADTVREKIISSSKTNINDVDFT